MEFLIKQKLSEQSVYNVGVWILLYGESNGLCMAAWGKFMHEREYAQMQVLSVGKKNDFYLLAKKHGGIKVYPVYLWLLLHLCLLH